MTGLRSNGLTCIVKCHTQELLDIPPSIGSFLTVKHSGFLKNGTLRYPFYWRLAGKQVQLLVLIVSFERGINENLGYLI